MKPLASERTRTTARFSLVLVVAGAAIWAAVLLLSAYVYITGHFLIGSGAPTVEVLPQTYGEATGQAGLTEALGLGVRLLCASPAIVTAAVVIHSAWMTTRLGRQISHGTPFSRQALAALRRLSWMLLAGSVFVGLLDTAALVALGEARGNGDVWNVGLNLPTWPVGLIAAGLILAALSAAFRHGAHLQKEMEGVV